MGDEKKIFNFQPSNKNWINSKLSLYDWHLTLGTIYGTFFFISEIEI